MMEFQWVIRSFAKNIGPGVADVDSSRPVIKISLDFGLQKREILDSTGRITHFIHISTQGQKDMIARTVQAKPGDGMDFMQVQKMICNHR